MTTLVNNPEEFPRQALEGFVQANRAYVRGVFGGVVRASKPDSPTVAIVVGGGSGHFPAFAGWVGEGMADGAVCGNIFSSPSAAQIASVAKAAHNGRGVLFMPINYAGDILHFTEAARQLRAEGIDARLVPITDDIASATREERKTRRGIAGSFIGIKIAAAAAATGAALDDVERVATSINEATTTFGAAFAGCTLPGADSPLFEIPTGTLALGLGIHGEPGLSEHALGTADQVTDLIIDGLLADRQPAPGARVTVLVNGLGTTKYDELFVVLRRTLERLNALGLDVVAPVADELVTSMDMAGLSISIAELTPELLDYWLASAQSAQFSRPKIVLSELVGNPLGEAPAGRQLTIDSSSAESRQSARALKRLAERAAAEMVAQREFLGRLDSVAGDGDHGIGMVTGTKAAVEAIKTAVEAQAGLRTALRLGGQAWSDIAGGTSGALWGAGLMAAAESFTDETVPTEREISQAVATFAAEIAQRGGASVGDKTMLDALTPFVNALQSGTASGLPLRSAFGAAAATARTAAEATAELTARLGRSRTHGERSLGTPDPGAISFVLLVEAIVGAQS